MKPVLHVGIDVGSTTVKIVALSPRLKLLFGRYERHMSDIRHASLALLKELAGKFSEYRITASISGSGGLGLSHWMELPFCQEILAETKAIDTFYPETDVIIELGGEDEKITYLQNGVDQRMNGACAGGTGAFIDRMATLLSTDAQGLNTLAEKSGQIYPIASRCGVFAKTDIQSLLNEGASQ
ncbi:MAG: BadF/BadG/BcrA/BcrD ATPase family protein [Dialister sp.]